MNPNDKDTNPDAITGAPGSHPVGTGVGAVGGGATGAAIGSAAGPIGTVAGAVIGAVAGAYAGKGVAEMIDPAAENAYWRDNYSKETYAKGGLGYDEYEPAYRTGYTGYGKHAGKKWDDVENDLERDYEQAKGKSSLAWSDAKHATKAAWHKVERALPGDADGDGR
ncbi:MAG: glycine zipper domain-containing protein [Chthoniobacterales bacterium]